MVGSGARRKAAAPPAAKSLHLLQNHFSLMTCRRAAPEKKKKKNAIVHILHFKGTETGASEQQRSSEVIRRNVSVTGRRKADRVPGSGRQEGLFFSKRSPSQQERAVGLTHTHTHRHTHTHTHSHTHTQTVPHLSPPSSGRFPLWRVYSSNCLSCQNL